MVKGMKSNWNQAFFLSFIVIIDKMETTQYEISFGYEDIRDANQMTVFINSQNVWRRIERVENIVVDNISRWETTIPVINTEVDSINITSFTRW